jgi:hypothetical protein
MLAASEPLVLIDGDIPIEDHSSAPEPVAAVPSRRWRRYRDAALALGVIGAALVGLQLAYGQATAATAPAAAPSASAPATTMAFPKLVAPATARPGQQLTLLGYEPHGRCDQTALLLDGGPAAMQIVELIDSAQSGWDGMVLTVDLPATLAPGSHQLDLLGALPGAGHGADICDDEPMHQGRIATATIIVG